MRTLVQARTLEFTREVTDDHEAFLARTPFGCYVYERNEEGNIEVSADFDERAPGPFAIAGNAITAQQLCRRDFERRLKDSMEFAE